MERESPPLDEATLEFQGPFKDDVSRRLDQVDQASFRRRSNNNEARHRWKATIRARDFLVYLLRRSNARLTAVRYTTKEEGFTLT